MDSSTTAISLPIMESFYTIQGEGVHNGKAAYFIRLGGCDVGCVWCDVKESWDAEKHPLTSIETLVIEAKEHPGRLVVITGGEPLMYDMLPLTEALRAEGFETNIETSGAYEMSGAWDWVCFSPKKFKEPHESIFPVANELKAIIFNKSDFAFAEKYAELVNDDCQLLLQPEWDKQEQMLPLIIDYVKANPKWKISLQTHKFMDIP
ncbi:7-carboxy-7-deazaguanine synthase QueE [Arcticibacterium luteifluviistationis]|nr:7-carboxy-7-deazaguanine synthase QueE [Arcticibacterium luteifluviistationis]